MNSKNLLVYLILIALTPFTSLATYTGLTAEIYQEDGVPGYVTWRIYANFDDTNDQLVALYGLDNPPFQSSPLEIHTTGDFYQDINGGPTSIQMNPAFWSFVPELEWDSFITIGYPDNTGNLMTSIGFDYTDFENGNSWTVNDIFGGSVFNSPGDPFNYPVGGKVLVAQLTTNGDIDLLMNFQWRDGAQVSYEAEAETLSIPFPVIIDGCTDENALNYDSTATIDDGSCTYPAPSFVDLSWEEHAVDGVAGTSTYRVYANFTNSFDQVTAVYGQEDSPLYINTTTSFYQNASAGFTSNSIDPATFPFDPELEYDSWVTIGAENGPNGTDELGINSAPFEAGGNLDISDPVGGAWYVLPDAEPAAFPDGSGRVLLAQLTTDGFVDLVFNLQYRAQDGSNPQEVDLPLSFPPVVDGCTNPLADNYNSNANQDDGSCIISGCTYPDATNYDSTANLEDGSCVFACNTGCTDSTALNYNSEATEDDGSCIFLGCTDSAACNYDSTATTDDGSCELPNVIITVGGGTFDSEITWSLELDGASVASGGAPADVAICADAGCYTMTMNDSFGDGWNGATYDITVDGVSVASGDIDSAQSGDGSSFGTDLIAWGDDAGCTDSTACNYDSTACGDDGSCVLPDGCTDSTACNYDSTASCDDGSCCFDNCITLDMFDAFGDGWNGATYNITLGGVSVATGDIDTAQSGDGSSLGTDVLCLADGCYEITVAGGPFESEITWTLNGVDGGSVSGAAPETAGFSVNRTGCTDSTACNYDSTACADDGSCLENDACGDCGGSGVAGCTDCNSTNYDSTATCDDGSCIATVLGCTDTTATNYDSTANTDNGGCIYFVELLGCTDSTAINYNALANTDDGSCIANLPGCTDSAACNYDSTATVDDSSCLENDECGNCGGSDTAGCNDSTACNYDSTAGCDDGSCEYLELYSGDISVSIAECGDFADGASANWPEILTAALASDGASSQAAQSFTMNVTSLPVGGADYRVYKTTATGNDFFGPPQALVLGDNSQNVAAVGFDRTVKFQFSSGDVEFNYLDVNDVESDCVGSVYVYDCDGNCINDVDGDDVCDELDDCIGAYDDCGVCNGDGSSCSGCTYSDATNYDSTATLEDGSCVFACDFPGCTDSTALNFNSAANVDDGSCIAVVSGCTDATATNYDSTANVDDGSCIATVLGCTDTTAFNYDSGANTDNGGCIAVQPGCMDSSFDNYNPYANEDDASCENVCPGDFDFNGTRNTADLLTFLTFFGVDCE
jgi:hypothetical protein